MGYGHDKFGQKTPPHREFEKNVPPCRVLNMELPAIEKEALLLPDTERALLADRLLASLNVESSDLRQQWITEAESRLEAYQNGGISAVDGPQTMASLRAKFGR